MMNIAQTFWNLATSIATFVADGCHTVDHAEYEARLRTCDACPDRNGTLCGQCNCIIPLKAQGRAMQCPLGKWANLLPTQPPEGNNSRDSASGDNAESNPGVSEFAKVQPPALTEISDAAADDELDAFAEALNPM